MIMNTVNFPLSWLSHIEGEFQKEYMKKLESFLQEEIEHHQVYPPEHLIFSALERTPFDKVKVVLLGQDPYHGPGQAHGFCFSVQQGVALPPSLVNIYKELKRDLGTPMPNHGDLTSWAEQGVLLLNTTLTVREGVAKSHAKRGWEQFTDVLIETVSRERKGVVFLLWGAHAQSKIPLIDKAKHCVLQTVHPSPLSAYRGFHGCGHFSACNSYLQERGESPIRWTL